MFSSPTRFSEDPQQKVSRKHQRLITFYANEIFAEIPIKLHPIILFLGVLMEGPAGEAVKIIDDKKFSRHSARCFFSSSFSFCPSIFRFWDRFFYCQEINLSDTSIPPSVIGSKHSFFLSLSRPY